MFCSLNMNLIERILKNNESYTQLHIEQSNYDHYLENKDNYENTYNETNFNTMIYNALTKNNYINELYIDCECNTNITDIVGLKIFHSIYVNTNVNYISKEIITFMNKNEYYVKRLKLGSILVLHDEIWLYLKNNKCLETFHIMCSASSYHDITKIISKLQESNIKTLTVSFSNITLDKIYEYVNRIIKKRTQITRLYIENDINYCGIKKNKKKSHSFVDKVNSDKIDKLTTIHVNKYKMDNSKNNHRIIDFKIYGKSNDEMKEFAEKNKKYFVTILACFKKRKIPKCVVMNLIWKDI